MPDPVVRAENVSRRFGKHTAVDHVSLEVARGEIFGLVGPDGAGKTTVLRLLTGLLDPDEGEILTAGLDVSRELEGVKDRIGYMSQRFSLYGDLSVAENMRFFAELYGLEASRREQLANRLLAMTRMSAFRERQARKLSGGMRQKLALMCSLLHEPEVLFLDEPTNGVDPVSRRDFWTILYQLVKERVTVVIATAYLDEAERCDRVGLMYRGRMIECATPATLRGKLGLTCYHLECPDPRSARRLLSGQPGVVAAELSGAAVRIFVGPDGPPAEVLKRTAEEAGLEPAILNASEPTLEDVFISIVRAQPEHLQ